MKHRLPAITAQHSCTDDKLADQLISLEAFGTLIVISLRDISFSRERASGMPFGQVFAYTGPG